MADEGRPRPFHERFDIDIGVEDARQRFINRINILVFTEISNGRLSGRKLATDNIKKFALTKHVAIVLGEPYDSAASPAHYVRGDFFRCLHVLEALYDALQVSGLENELSTTVRATLDRSEIDLGVDWQPPQFVRTGARVLDEHLVNEPMRWLAAPQYKSVRQPFEKGLAHYLEAQNRPDRLADVVTDMYEAVEALAKIVTGRSKEDLSGNAARFISEVDTSQHYKTLLRNYISYGNEFRHAEREGRPRPPLSEPEVESFIYLTGLFIRLVMRTT